MPILSRVSSKTGQILSGSVFDVEFDIEMWGGKGGTFAYFPSPPYFQWVTDEQRQGGLGGYTKLTMIVPSNYTLQVRPSYYSGGGGAVQTRGGVASGFGIDNEWLAVVGGGGGAGGNLLYSFETRSLQFMGAQPGRPGSGGYGTGDPSNGQDGLGCVGTEPARDNLYGLKETGAGGGGAPGGTSEGTGRSCNGFWYDPGGTGAPGYGGGGNIRIYKDQSILDGYLNIFPDVKMTYVTHSNGVSSAAKVRITNTKTSSYTDYTSNTDIKVQDITKF